MLVRVSNYVHQFGRGLWILSLGWLVSAMGFAISIPFIAIYFSREFGWSTFQIGLYFGGLAIVRSVFQAAGGEISDRMSRLRVLIDTQLLRSCAYVFLAASIYFNWGPWIVSIALYTSAVFSPFFSPPPMQPFPIYCRNLSGLTVLRLPDRPAISGGRSDRPSAVFWPACLMVCFS